MESCGIGFEAANSQLFKKRAYVSNFLLFSLLYWLQIFILEYHYYNRLCNFSNVPVLGSLDSDDFDYLQNFIRSELHEILVSKYDEKKLPFDNQYNPCFYGIYSSLRNKFSFTRGDMKILQLVVANVANKLEDEICTDIEYHYSFKNKRIKNSLLAWQNCLVETPIGLFYGEKIDSKIDQPLLRNEEKLKANLAARCRKIFSFYPNLKKVREFEDSFVYVYSISGTYKGTVTCPFCQPLSPVVSTRVTYQVNGESGSWISSNLTKHINHHHVENSDVVEVQKDVDRKMCNQKTKKSDVQSDMELGMRCNMETSFDSTNYSENDSRLLSLEIEPLYSKQGSCKIQLDTKHEDLKYSFFKQLSTQGIEMTNACILNSESAIAFYSKGDFVDKNNCKQVQRCCIESDGDCMFGSISNQLFGEKIGSIDHKNSTVDLRRKTVSYIQKNMDKFMPFLKDRVYTQLEKNGVNLRVAKNIHLKAECLNFLKNELIDKNKAWGGTESLMAITEMESVNILIINDDGSCNMVTDFDEKNSRTIALCFNQTKKHYDSVVSVDEQTMFDFIESVLKSQMMKKQDCCIVIE